MALPGQGVGTVETAATDIQRVHGVVLNAVTNQPISRALVTSGDQRMAMLTDNEGKFEFEVRVPRSSDSGGGPVDQIFARGNGFGAGGFVSLNARKPGYLNDQPVYIMASDHAVLSEGVEVKLIPEAIITGRVAAPGIDAPMGVQVQLMRKQVQDGRALWRVTAGVQSNLHGEYRLANLQAGEYKIKTAEWRQPGTPQVEGKPMVGYPSVSYLDYPERGGPASPAVLHIGAGQTIQANLNLRPKPYYTVEIPVANYVQGGYQLSVEGQDSESLFALGFDQGKHSIVGALPNGAYHLLFSTSDAEVRVATVDFTVAGQAFRTEPVALLPARTIPVVVREDFTATRDARNGTARGGGDFGGSLQVGDGVEDSHPRTVEVFLQPEALNTRGAGLKPSVKGQGNEGLVLENVLPGSYRVVVSPRLGYAAEVTSRGVDLLHRPLVVAAQGSTPPIEITLRDDPGTVSGTVSPLPAQRISGPFGNSMWVWCVPVGDDGPGRIAQGYAGPDGKFTVQSVLPGRYVVFASSTQINQTFEYRNEEAMKPLESKGSLVTVSAGQEVSTTAPVIVVEAH